MPLTRNNQIQDPTVSAKTPEHSPKPAARESLLSIWTCQIAGRDKPPGMTSRLSRQRRRAYTWQFRSLSTSFLTIPKPKLRQSVAISENALNISRLPEFNGIRCTLLWNTAGGTDHRNRFKLWLYRNAPLRHSNRLLGAPTRRPAAKFMI